MSRRCILTLLLGALLGLGAGVLLGRHWGDGEGFRRGFRWGMERGRKSQPVPVNASTLTQTDLEALGLSVPSGAYLEALNTAPCPCPALRDAGRSLAACLSSKEDSSACPSCRSQAEYLAARTAPDTSTAWLVDRARRETRWAISEDRGSLLGGKGPVPLLVFTDYQCPFCARLDPELAKLAREDPNVTVRVLPFPLPMHPEAKVAARAALAAELQGKFPAMHEALFALGKDIQAAARMDPPFRELALSLGLDLDRYREDLEDEAQERVLEQGRSLAKSVGVAGTPAIFIDGLRYKGERDLNSWRGAIAAAKKSQDHAP